MMKTALFQVQWISHGAFFNKVSIKLVCICFSLFFVPSETYGYNMNIRLTRFAKNLISLYIDQSADEIEYGTIVIECTSDSLHYYAQLYEDQYASINKKNSNMISYKGYTIVVSGTYLPILFSGKITDSCSKPNTEFYTTMEPYINYDPVIWQLSFHKDYKLCKMFTYKSNPYEDISDIIKLSQKFLSGSETVDFDKDYIYSNIEVDHPAEFILGDEELYDIIKTQIYLSDEDLETNVPVIINMIVNKDGDAHIAGFLKESNNPSVNKQSMRAAELVASYKFIPATHRGEQVCVFFPLYFVKSFFIRQ